MRININPYITQTGAWSSIIMMTIYRAKTQSYVAENIITVYLKGTEKKSEFTSS